MVDFDQLHSMGEIIVLNLALTSWFDFYHLQIASSINGPFRDVKEENQIFPLYPHCYVFIVQRKFAHLWFSKLNHRSCNRVIAEQNECEINTKISFLK